MNGDSGDRREGRISTDRETIRGWAEEHGAVPIRSTGTEEEEFRVASETDVGDSHERVEWDEFFARLDEGDHVVVYHESAESDPFDVTRRDDLLARSAVNEAELEERLIEGETVTSEITETTVVESVIVEEATVESDLVDSAVTDERIVDVELLGRECTGCSLIDEDAGDDRDWFDEDRYLGTVGGRGQSGTAPATAETEADEEADDAEPTPIGSADDVPYTAELEVEEAWSVTREFVERFTVESRIAGTEVAETDTVEDRDIDVEGLHQSIAQSDLLDVDLTSDEVMTECDIQTEFGEGDRIQTEFERERVVEEEIVDRKRVRADVTGGELLGMETVRSREVATEGAGEESAGAEAETDRTTLTEDEVGKTVTDATGEEIGMVTGVDESAERLHVDARPGITDRIKAALDWGDTGDDAYPVDADQIERVTDDRVELKGTEELDAEGRPE